MDAEEGIDWEGMHRKLGCYGCKFADKKALGVGACCQNINGVLPDIEGKCNRRVGK